MTNEAFQKLMLEQLTELNNVQKEIKQSLTRIENDHLDINQRILDSLARVENKLDQISLKVTAHEAALKRAKYEQF